MDAASDNRQTAPFWTDIGHLHAKTRDKKGLGLSLLQMKATPEQAKTARDAFKKKSAEHDAEDLAKIKAKYKDDPIYGRVSKESAMSNMNLLTTPGKRIIKEQVLGVPLKEEFEDLEGIFRSVAGPGASISAQPNGQDVNSHIITITGPSASANASLCPNGVDHKRFMDELRSSLAASHYKLVSFTYREDPADNSVTCKYYVKVPPNL